MFLFPLLYVSNQELIDHHVRNASTIVNQQAEQVKQLASYHASAAAKATQQYASDYTAMAQEMVGVKPTRSTSEATTKPTKTESTNKPSGAASSATYKPSDFPAVPKDDLKATTATVVGSRDEQEPLAV